MVVLVEGEPASHGEQHEPSGDDCTPAVRHHGGEAGKHRFDPGERDRLHQSSVPPEPV